MSKPNTITLTTESYIGLLNDSRMLAILETLGVENWEGYQEAVSQMKEDYDRN